MAVIFSGRRPASMGETSFGACVRRRRTDGPSRAQIDFRGIASAALARLPDLLCRWLPEGGARARNGSAAIRPAMTAGRAPSRSTCAPAGGRTSPPATAAAIAISLAAYLFDLSQADAARRIAAMLGIDGGAR